MELRWRTSVALPCASIQAFDNLEETAGARSSGRQQPAVLLQLEPARAISCGLALSVVRPSLQ